MAKQSWKPGNMLYPLPAVLVSTADKKGGTNLFTVAWTGTICSDPPMVSISVRPERYSMIVETGEFVINLTTEELTYATDYCGVKSGRDVDKWKEVKLTPVKADKVQAPLVAEPCKSGVQSNKENSPWNPRYVSGRGSGSPCGRSLYG